MKLREQLSHTSRQSIRWVAPRPELSFWAFVVSGRHDTISCLVGPFACSGNDAAQRQMLARYARVFRGEEAGRLF